jgi:hypothetical protein
MQTFQLHDFVDQLVCRPFNYMTLWTILYACLSITEFVNQLVFTGGWNLDFSARLSTLHWFGCINCNVGLYKVDNRDVHITPSDPGATHFSYALIRGPPLFWDKAYKVVATMY